MRGQVVVLHDAAAAEGRPDAADTLAEVEAIRRALVQRDYSVSVIPVGLDLTDLERALTALRPCVAFNLVESIAGRGELIAVVPALLDSLGIGYTGCPPTALMASSNKVVAKGLLDSATLPTPPLFSDGCVGTEQWIVKSVTEHSSLGIDDRSIVEDEADLRGQLEARRREFGGRWFAERFVPGRELNVALLATPKGPRSLPVAEIRFVDFPAGRPAIVGYAAKWDVDSFEYSHTERSFAVEASLAEQLTALAWRCWRLFELAGYARIDFRVDAAGAPWILEINANPCLAPDAGFAAALRTAGIDYGEALEWLVEDGRARAGIVVGGQT